MVLLSPWHGYDNKHDFLDMATLRIVEISGYDARNWTRKWKGKFAMSRQKLKHGCTKKPWYKSWEAMWRRTTDGARRCYSGIKVCADWRDPRKFGEWAEANGFTPGLTIERKNVKLGYEPDNCEWVTMSENVRRSHISSPRTWYSGGRFAKKS